MDFMNRGEQPQAVHNPTPASSAGVPRSSRPAASNLASSDNKLVRIGAVCLLIALTILAVAAIALLGFGGSRDQDRFINNKEYQAVFLTNGQVYFGKLNEINRDYFRLNNIFYLTQNTTTASNGQTTSDGNYTLVKLGCQQIHDPIDQMVIERSQVSFWENLQDSGKVVTSIKQFQKQNPNGPDCSQVSSQTQASSSNSQGGSSAATGTTSAAPTTTAPSTTTTKKP